jgi:hypothetical protein
MLATLTPTPAPAKEKEADYLFRAYLARRSNHFLFLYQRATAVSAPHESVQRNLLAARPRNLQTGSAQAPPIMTQ